ATGVSINGASSADSTSGTFNLVADNALSFTSAGTIGAHDVLLTSTNKGLSFAGAITAINTTLTAHDDIIDSSTASVGTTSLTVNSTSGSIGTGTGARFFTNAADLIATASGSVFLRDTNATGVSVNGVSSADSTSGTFNLVADNAFSSTSAGTIGAHDVLLTSTNKGLSLAGA